MFTVTLNRSVCQGHKKIYENVCMLLKKLPKTGYKIVQVFFLHQAASYWSLYTETYFAKKNRKKQLSIKKNVNRLRLKVCVYVSTVSI